MSRIAFVTTMSGLPWGGSEALWSAAARVAIERGHTVLSVVFDWSRATAAMRGLESAGAEVLFRPRAHSRNVVERVVKRVAARAWHRFEHRWVDRVTDFDPDVLCISQGSVWEVLDDAAVMLLAETSACPVVHLCHSNHEAVVLSDERRQAGGALFGRAAMTLFVADAVRKLTERQLASLLPNVAVVRNPVNLAGLEPLRVGSRGERPTFANVASLTVRHKAQDVLLEVLSGPKWRDRDWTCRFYGEGPDRNYLGRLADHYDLGQRIEFMGHAPDIRAVWGECDLLLLPSRVEGLPMALVEAMVCGRPSVVTDVGGMSEWVVEAECGWVAEAATPSSFGAALERAWQGRRLWSEMGEAARSRALGRLDPDPGASLLELLLDEGTCRAEVANPVELE